MEGPAETPVERGIDQSDVLEKYKAAGVIIENAFVLIRKAAYHGMVVRTLCALGDKVIEKATSSVYSKARTETGEKLEKGVAFPTCVCIGHCAAHFCPIETDPEAGTFLSKGDVITVQMGVHIDGYCAMGAQTIVVRESKDEMEVEAVEGRPADVISAAYTAAEAVLRVMKAGETNERASQVIEKVAKEFGVEALEGVLSHQMKRYVIDGSKVIMNRCSMESKADRWEFENYEVYNLDVVMSSGEGKAKETNTRESVYKRQVDVDYKLKLKSSRQIFSEINKKYATMPFTLRSLSDPKRSRMAMTEMVRHSLVTAYPVLYEKEGETIGRCSMTVLITPSQTIVVNKGVMPGVKCERMIEDEEVKGLLATSMDKKKRKRKKKGGEVVDAMET